MVDYLAGVRALVDDQPVARVVYAMLGRKISGDEGHVPDQRFARLLEARQKCDVVNRYNQQMYRRGGADVLERDHAVIRIERCAGNFALDDLAEDAIRIWGHERVRFRCRS